MNTISVILQIKSLKWEKTMQYAMFQVIKMNITSIQTSSFSKNES